MHKTAIAALALAMLAACDRQPAPPPPTPTPTVPADTGSASIIRPEVEAKPEPAPPLAPLTLRIGFDEGGTVLSDPAIATLDQALASEQTKAGGAITLGGHSDSAGGDAANLAVSRQRAQAVRDWLVEHGIAEDRITVVAFGEQNPVAPNALPDGAPDPAGRAENRRVELTIAAPQQASSAPASAPSEDTTLVDRLAGEK
jgi:OOP family OmpA-OmpF porin